MWPVECPVPILVFPIVCQAVSEGFACGSELLEFLLTSLRSVAHALANVDAMALVSFIGKDILEDLVWLCQIWDDLQVAFVLPVFEMRCLAGVAFAVADPVNGPAIRRGQDLGFRRLRPRQ